MKQKPGYFRDKLKGYLKEKKQPLNEQEAMGGMVCGAGRVVLHGVRALCTGAHGLPPRVGAPPCAGVASCSSTGRRRAWPLAAVLEDAARGLLQQHWEDAGTRGLFGCEESPPIP